MPIYSNFGYGIEIYHKPIPGTLKDRDALRKAFIREKLKRSTLSIEWEKGFLKLQTTRETGLLAEAMIDHFWKRMGKVIKATGEPWWEFCILIEDDRGWAQTHLPKAQLKVLTKHPYGHALSVIRISATGSMSFLSMEEFE